MGQNISLFSSTHAFVTVFSLYAPLVFAAANLTISFSCDFNISNHRLFKGIHNKMGQWNWVDNTYVRESIASKIRFNSSTYQLTTKCDCQDWIIGKMCERWICWANKMIIYYLLTRMHTISIHWYFETLNAQQLNSQGGNYLIIFCYRYEIFLMCPSRAHQHAKEPFYLNEFGKGEPSLLYFVNAKSLLSFFTFFFWMAQFLNVWSTYFFFILCCFVLS